MLKPNPTFDKLDQLDRDLVEIHNADARDFQHLLVAAQFGRASAALRGTVWSGSAARGESLNSNNVPFLGSFVYLLLP